MRSGTQGFLCSFRAPLARAVNCSGARLFEDERPAGPRNGGLLRMLATFFPTTYTNSILATTRSIVTHLCLALLFSLDNFFSSSDAFFVLPSLNAKYSNHAFRFFGCLPTARILAAVLDGVEERKADFSGRQFCGAVMK
jgi:hypothetical protein